MIVPLWEKTKYRPGKRWPIYLDPRGTFGSGAHETTRLIVRLMEKLDGRFSSFLDIGMGSGILSVAAWRLGAQTLWGFDCDGNSVKTARVNLLANQCKVAQFFQSDIARFSCRKQFDLVGANLDTNLLRRYKNKITASVRLNQYLIISGILARNFREIRPEFRDAPLRCLKILKSRGWISAFYQRVKSSTNKTR